MLASVAVDPFFETGDADIDNNNYPKKEAISRFQMFKQEKEKNTMQKMNGEPNAKTSSTDGTKGTGSEH